jgi:uncharacterized protein YecE (DUF72 family)
MRREALMVSRIRDAVRRETIHRRSGTQAPGFGVDMQPGSAAHDWRVLRCSGHDFCPIRSLSLQMQERPMAKIHIGTSGWSYRSWRGPFFPEEVKIKDHLRFYASQFGTAELNGVFYRTPTEDAVRGWHDQTPDDFVFAWKASKFITHWKRLSGKSKNSLALMESRLKLLRHKAGPVLFQLPPMMQLNYERLASFLKLLRKQRRYAFEFRHPSWYEDRILGLLRDHDVSLCLSDHHDAPAPWEVTASFVYVRGHGPGGRYRGHYPVKTLRGWADDVGRWRRERREVFVYFDNDQKSAAPLDALRLNEMVEAKRSRALQAA